MDTKPLCPSCGKPLDASAPKGLCPECLMKGAFPTRTDTGGKSPRFVPPKIEELAAKFPQLEILGFIGQGGMGAVYKARQKQLDQVVALKILPPGIGQDAAFAGRFVREARALAKLNHPGIVTIHDFGQADGLFYFVMEFVDGLTLRQLLNASRIVPKEALAIVPQICDALQFAHDQGIVHRDIKPENILLDRRGRVKVADFGLAKLMVGDHETPMGESAAGSPALTESGKIMGTPQYMAPEQVAHPLEVDHRADIYSLGVVFYQMLTGELPTGKFESPSKKVAIDVRLDEVVLRALEKNPELRYQQASALKTQVETIAMTPPPSSTMGDVPTPPQELQLLHFEGILRFRSPLALKLAQVVWRLGCLGFLGVLGFIPGWERLFGLFGLFGFFGLIGIAYVIDGYARYKGSPALKANPPSSQPAKPASSPDLNKQRWEVTIWGFILAAGWIDVGLHTTTIGWIIAAWGMLLFLIPTLLAWLSGDDPGKIKFAAQMVLTNGIAVASAGIWCAVNSLDVQWAVPVSLACLGGIAFCLRCLMIGAKTEVQAPANLGCIALCCALLGGITLASLYWLPTSWFFAGDIRIWLTPVFALLAIVLGGVSWRFRPALPAVILGGMILLIWLPMLIAGQRQSPRAVIAEIMQREVGRQLREAGATFDELQVDVAEKRSTDTPFTVTYMGLRHFKHTHGGQPDPGWPDRADGQFIMQYTGDGDWQGSLGDQQFNVHVQIGNAGNTDLPAANSSSNATPNPTGINSIPSTETRLDLSFTPAVERTLTNSQFHPTSFGLDSHKTVTELSPQFPPAQDSDPLTAVLAVIDWMRQERLDFFYGGNEVGDWMIGVDMKLQRVDNDDWNRMSTAQLLQMVAAIKTNALVQARIDMGRTNFPSTYAFETRGSTGLLQCFDRIDNTNGPDYVKVNIRYKLVQNAPTAGTGIPFANPGMEDGTDTPDGWEKGPPITGVEQIWDHAIAHSGNASLCLKKTVQRYFPTAQWSQEIAVEPAGQSRKLHVQCWVKAEKVTKAIVDVTFQNEHAWAIYIGQKAETDPLATHDWKLCEGTVEVPANASKVGIVFQIYGPGTIWYDDLDVAWQDE